MRWILVKRKRLLALALSFCLLLPVAASAAQAPASSAETSAVRLFAPPVSGDNVTRGEFIELLAASSGEDLSESAWISMEEYFTDGSDVSDGVKWAFEKWILNGDGGAGGERGALRLSDALSRQEAAALLGRYLDYRYTDLPAGCGTGSPDNYNIASWAQNGVSKCWMYGVIDMSEEENVSYGDGTASSALEFRPLDPVSDAEAAEWIAAANAVDASAITAPENPGFADSLVRAADAEGNWSLSPYSIRLCLAMLTNGAKGDTRQELLEALQIDDLEAFNESVKKQLETYDGYGRIMSLNTANSLWLNQSWFGGKGEYLPVFAEQMDKYYRATVEEVTNADSVERVNAWVNEKTNGKIPSILTEDNRNFVTALVNAVYFKAAWEQEFSPELTDKAEFTNADGAVSEVDMMHQTGGFGYYSTPGVEAVKMDYRNYAVDNEEGDNWEHFSDADFSMYLIKADGRLDVQNLLDNAEFTSGKVRLSVPRFKVEYAAELDKALGALGVKTAYDEEKADLTAMLDPSSLPGGQHFLETVLHKTYIAVDEKGTEAAAVTAAVDEAGSAMPTRPVLVREFTADGPFWFAIRDNTGGEILFVGQYQNA